MRKNRLLVIIIISLFFIGQASATIIVSETYGDGWKQVCYDDGKCSYSNYYTIQQWDGQYIPVEWLNINTGQWSYYYSENATYYDLYRLGERLSIIKSFANYTFDLNKISLEFTVTPAQLASRSTLQVIDGQNYWYITIPDKAVKTQFLWDNKLPIISNETEAVLNQSEYDAEGTLLWQNYKYVIVGDKIRLYYNQTVRNFGLASSLITFKFDSWIVGTDGNAWSENSSFENFMLDRDTNTIKLPTNVSDGLVSYWGFNGNSGIIAYDMNLTSNNNGTLTNMNTGLNNGSSGWNSSGKYGNALAFDGVNDYVNMGNGASLNNTDGITIVGWIYTNKTTRQRMIAKPSAYLFGTDVNYQLIFTLPGVWDAVSTSVNWEPNKWEFVTITYDKTNVKFYKNGNYIQQIAKTNAIPTSTDNLWIGNYAGTEHFNGTIDEIRIYNWALSNNEINQTMNNTMKKYGYVKTSYNTTDTNVTYQVSSNGTFPTNTNQSGQYAQNGSSPSGYLNPENQTINYTWATVPSYQDTDWYTWLFGNDSATPEISLITFWTQAISAGYQSNITSWGNNYTNNELLSLSATAPLAIQYNATANQSITNWYCVNSSYVNGNDSTDGICEQYYNNAGTYYPSMYGSNANGSTLNSVNWTITVQDTTPPASITGLTNITGNFWHNWTWTNPVDVDFNYTMIYINNNFIVNQSAIFYNLTSSAHNESTISIKTVDTTGNINTTWVNHTSIIPNNAPTISFINPTLANASINTTGSIQINTSVSDTDSDNMTALLNWNQSLVGWWRMNEAAGGTLVQDFSGYGNNGTWYGNTTSNVTTGQFGNALTFDGVNDHINITSASSLDLSALEVIKSQDVIAHQGIATDGSNFYLFDTTSIKKYDVNWNLVKSNLNASIEAGINHIGDGEYYNEKLYVATLNYTNCTVFSDMRISIWNATDLSFVSQHNISAPGLDASGLTIDANNGIIYISSYCNGTGYWKYNLTTFEYIGFVTISSSTSYVQGISYKNNYIYLSKSLNIYKYHAGNGTYIEALSTKGHEGIDYTTDIFYSLIDDYRGNLVYYLKSRIDKGATISYWMKTPYIPSQSKIYERHIWTSDNNFALFYRNDTGVLQWLLTTTEGNLPRPQILGAVLPANQWHYITAVYNASNKSAELYLDDTLQSMVVRDGTGLRSLFNWNISSTAYCANGSIDEVRIYNRALSAAEINASYNAGLYRLNTTMSGLSEGTYNYTAFIQDAYGTIGQTDMRYVTVDTIPAQVQNLINGTVSTTTVNLSWNTNTEPDLWGYQIFRNDNHLVYTQNNYYNDTGLIANTTYNYIVRANDTIGNWGTNSSTLEATTNSNITQLPNITSWSNDNTLNNNITLSVLKNTNITFNITANQSVTTTWTGTANPTKINGTDEAISYAYKNFTNVGTYIVIASCSNINGTCTNPITWTITANGLGDITFSGYIYNSLELPLENTRIDFNGSYDYSNSTGYYEFTNISDGIYSFLVRAIGYENVTDTIILDSDTSANYILIERTWATTEDTNNAGIIGFLGGILGGAIAAGMIRKLLKI